MNKFKVNFKSTICFLISFSIILNLLPNEIKASDESSLDIFNSFCNQIEENDIVIASTTDIHGSTNRYIKASTAINKLREKSNNTWIQDNGDIFQGDFSSVLPLYAKHLKKYSNAQIDKNTWNDFLKKTDEHPIVTCLRHIGFDAITLGNHEFIYPYNDNPNKDVMKKAFENIEKDNGPSILAANIYKRDENGNYTCAFNPWRVKEYNVNGKTYKIGVLGLEFIGTDDENPPYHYEGLTFCHPSNTEHSALEEIKRYVEVDKDTGKKKLINGTNNASQDVDFFIVSYHSPSKSEDDSKLSWPKSSLRNLAANNDFVDLYIAGHDHMPLAEELKNKNDKTVWVMNAGQTGLAMACLKIDKDSESTSVKCCKVAPYLLDNYKKKDHKTIENDPELEGKIKEPLDTIKALLKTSLGKTSSDFVPGADNNNKSYAIQNELMSGNNDTVSLFARALIDAVKKYAPSDFHKDKHLIVFNRPGNKAVEKNSPFLLETCSRLSYYENNFCVIKVSGKIIKKFAEAEANLYVENTTNAKNTKKYDWTNQFPNKYYKGVFYGLSITFDPTRSAGNKILKITSSQTGKEIKDDEKFSLILSRYDASPDGIFGKLFGEQNPNNYWDSVELGTVEGLIKFQLARYVLSLNNTPIGHDNTKFGYEILINANVNENPKPNPTPISPGTKGGNKNLPENKPKDLRKISDPNSKNQINSNNVTPGKPVNNRNITKVVDPGKIKTAA